MKCFAIGAAMAAVLAASAAAETVHVVVAPPVSVTPLPADANPRPVALTRFAANIPPGTPWRDDARSPYFMVPCVDGRVSLWDERDNKAAGFDSFERIFREELKDAGFRNGSDPTNLFEEQRGSDIQVGALVTGLRLKTCSYITLVNTIVSGSAAMDVEWQIYSVSQAKVLARITTHGGLQLKEGRYVEGQGPDITPLLRGVFADNVRRLAADDQFRKIVLSAPDHPAPLAPSSMSFSAVNTATPMAAAVKSVVSIYGGDGMGSGVLVSPEGYILTNRHVAGDGGQVRVRWADGTESIGDVVRSDARRDVALVRAAPKASPLAIRNTPLQLGETVFAIGTPLKAEFANTLTRGIVSGTRLIDGLPMIQSDVAIDHGNSGGPLLDEQGRITALAVSRYEEDGVGHSINFFIPIDDALKALNLVAMTQAGPAAPAGAGTVTSQK
jgi:S1-C subfamily serine protease